MIGPTQAIAGGVSLSITVRVMQNTAGGTNPGDPLTGLANTSVAMSYRRTGAAVVAITDSAVALTAAYASGGWSEIGNGYYRFDLPNAAIAVGAAGVQIIGTVTNATVYAPHIVLTDPVNGLFKSSAIDSGSTSTAVIAAFGGYAASELVGELVWILDTSATEWHPAWVTGFATTSGTFTLASARNGGVMPFPIAATDRLWRSGFSRAQLTISGLGANAITATSIASNAITAAKIATDAITAAKIAANAIGASELAADAVTEIQSGLALATALTTAQNDLDIITGASGVNLLTATQASIDAIELDTGTTIPGTLAALNDLSAAEILTTALTEAYSTDGSTATLSELLYMIYGLVGEFSVSGTTLTVIGLDGATSKATFTLDSASDPTSITRAT